MSSNKGAKKSRFLTQQEALAEFVKMEINSPFTSEVEVNRDVTFAVDGFPQVKHTIIIKQLGDIADWGKTGGIEK